jgi:hypothetical protein
MRNCGLCHECRSKLRKVLDGEEWCPECEQYRRYRSHGWGWYGEGSGECPEPMIISPDGEEAANAS